MKKLKWIPPSKHNKALSRIDELSEQIAEANEIICDSDLTYQNDVSVKEYQRKHIINENRK